MWVEVGIAWALDGACSVRQDTTTCCVKKVGVISSDCLLDWTVLWLSIPLVGQALYTHKNNQSIKSVSKQPHDNL